VEGKSNGDWEWIIAQVSIMQAMTIEQLQEQLQVHEVELAELKDRIPDSTIISPKLLNRAFTVFGHYVVAGFIIAIPFICLTSLFALLMMLISQPQ
jgi:VIT1/CCC1 family predicted Fe2+/Mn2+ transporter